MTGRPADHGLDADLATLRDALATWDRLARLALDRVEADLARLREERDAAIRDYVARDRYDAMQFVYMAEVEKREAAEARCARLQQALRWYDEHKRTDGFYDSNLWGDLSEMVDTPVCARCQGHGTVGNSGVGTVSDCDECGGTGRTENGTELPSEALAGPGSEQSSLTESGPAGLPDTPAEEGT